jgi:hypothetical protein
LLTPTIGFDNGGDTSYDPAKYDQGIYFTHGKYVKFSAKPYIGTGHGATAIYMWKYMITGTVGNFIDLDLEVSHNL